MFKTLTEFQKKKWRVFLFLAVTLTGSACVPTNDLREQGSPGSTPNDYETQNPVGRSSQSLLNPEVFRSVTVEVQTLGKSEPTQEALLSLQRFLEKTLDKPDGITVHRAPPKKTYGESTVRVTDLLELERTHRQIQPFKSKLSLFLLFIDATSAEDTQTHQRFAHAFAQSSIVVYSPSLARYSGASGQVSRWVLEATVLQHEVGHLLGLVNTGTLPLGAHEDPGSSGHCKESSCLMRGNPLEALRAHQSPSNPSEIPELCQSCLEDLRAIRAPVQDPSSHSGLTKKRFRPLHAIHVPSKDQPKQREKQQETCRTKENPLGRLVSSTKMDSNLDKDCR